LLYSPIPPSSILELCDFSWQQRIVKNLEDQVKKEQDEHVKIIQSIPDKVNRECAALTDDINRYKKELVSLQAICCF
jgi:hypothetical protein